MLANCCLVPNCFTYSNVAVGYSWLVIVGLLVVGLLGKFSDSKMPLEFTHAAAHVVPKKGKASGKVTCRKLPAEDARREHPWNGNMPNEQHKSSYKANYCMSVNDVIA